MLKKIVTYFGVGNRLSGLEVYDLHGERYYSYIETQRNAESLKIVKSFSSSDLKEVVEKIDTKPPLLLIINTKEVLHKLVQDSKSEQALQQAFPNIEHEAFYTMTTMQPSKQIVSICRKNHLDAELKNLQELKLNICQIHIGFGTLDILSPWFSEHTIQNSNMSLEIEDGVIIRFTPLKERAVTSYTIQEVTLKANQLHLFASCIAFYQNHPYLGESLKSYNAVLLENQLQKQRFFKFRNLAVGFFLLLLLGNFFIFQYYFSKNEKLRGEVGITEVQKKQLLSLQENIRIKQNKANRYLQSTAVDISGKMDQMAANMPEAIHLEKWEYQPKAKKIQNNQPIDLEQNKVLLHGYIQGDVLFNQWLQSLEYLTWIAHIDILQFGYQQKNQARFELLITLKSDNL
ncbi:MAG: hypothetical protein OIF50_14600 [Flavobacteriaceae bacterium]|nr:hypothetical protein [Flavobacteriaceae bacterium]